ncbi:MAG: hypothetical protein ACOCR1_03885 [Planctomycetota bacterium]
MRHPRTRTVLTAMALLLIALPGCSLINRRKVTEREFESGTVRYLDTSSARTLEVLEEETERGSTGRLNVTITWNNTSDSPYIAKMRRIFIDEQGLKERGAYQWDVETFPPGKSRMSWKSYSVDAVHYRIELRKGE